MSDGLIITLDEFKAYLGPEAQKSSEKDDVLYAYILAAEELVRGQCSQNFDQRSYTAEYHSGRGKPYLWARQVPVAADPLPVVTENGVALTVAAGYSASAQVSFNPVDGCFTRQPYSLVTATYTPGPLGEWPAGNNNVVLAYTGGYAAAAMPADLKLLIKFVAAYSWRQSDRKEQTVRRRSGQSGSTDFWEEIPPFYAAIMRRYSVTVHGE